jgi:hypothetical protein
VKAHSCKTSRLPLLPENQLIDGGEVNARKDNNMGMENFSEIEMSKN